MRGSKSGRPLICEVGAGLQYAHEAGLVHRDVKPANIVLNDVGRAKLTDFDLVRAADTTGGTRSGMLGTFMYAAPECLDKAKDASPAADVFSLGMTTIFALYGADLPVAAYKRPERFIERLRCAPELKRVLLRAIEEEPAKRFASCEAFCEALRRAASGGEASRQADKPVDSGPALAPVRDPVRPKWLRSPLELSLPVLSIAVFGLGIWMMSQLMSPPVRTSMVMVQVPKGTFKMGSMDGADDERPVHEVTLSRYAIYKTEVTVGQCRECVLAGKCTPPDTKFFCNWKVAGREEHPINCVDWKQADAYCRFVNKALPTEALARWRLMPLARSTAHTTRRSAQLPARPGCRGDRSLAGSRTRQAQG